MNRSPTGSGRPLVSVIVPVFNGSRFLADAVETVRRQDHRPLEIIVVDDGSLDDTAAVASRLGGGVIYIRQENKGPAAARNRGIEMAAGELLAFLDADDLWPADKLSRQVAYLEGHPGVGIVHGLIQEIDCAGTGAGSAAYSFVNLGGACIRRSVFDEIGAFDDGLRYNEDVDWFLRARDHEVVKVVLPEVALYYRKHAGSMTFGRSTNHLGLARVIRNHLRRRRRAGTAGEALPPVLEYLGIPAAAGGIGGSKDR